MVFLCVCISEYCVDMVVFPVVCAGFCRCVLRLYLTDSEASVRSGFDAFTSLSIHVVGVIVEELVRAAKS